MELNETVCGLTLLICFFLLAHTVFNLLIDWVYDLLQCPLKDEMICFVLDIMGTKLKLHMQYLGPESTRPGRYF